jgi:hypothetical protein
MLMHSVRAVLSLDFGEVLVQGGFEGLTSRLSADFEGWLITRACLGSKLLPLATIAAVTGFVRPKEGSLALRLAIATIIGARAT